MEAIKSSASVFFISQMSCVQEKKSIASLLKPDGASVLLQIEPWTNPVRYKLALRRGDGRRSAERCDDRRVIRRLFPFARCFVDDAGRAARRQRRREQDVIDAHAHVAAKRQLAVIPPAE